MISCITLKTAHLFRGNPIASMLQLRFRAVIERQEWDVPTWQNMEYDEFDNPATTYFVWRDGDDAVRGCARLYPTDRPYMLKEGLLVPGNRWDAARERYDHLGMKQAVRREGSSSTPAQTHYL